MTYAVEHLSSETTVAISSYNSLYWNTGTLINQHTGPNNEDNFIGPNEFSIGRPFEGIQGVGEGLVYAIDWSTTTQWVFVFDQSAANSTRHVSMYTYDKTGVNGLVLLGGIFLTYPSAGNDTIRAAVVTVDTYSTGTVSIVNGSTTVTGTGTAWVSSNFAAGARIGFGTTTPSSVTTWYEIATPSGLVSDTSITLTYPFEGVTNGTSSFVIEELRIITASTNSTAAQGGLKVAKGLHPGLFQQTINGTTIAAAVATDNIRAVYWLADAAAETNTNMAGLLLQPRDSYTQHYVWGVDGTATASASVKLYKYNLRVSLASIASGKTTSAWVLTSAAQTIVGTFSNLNTGIAATMNSGPGSGTLCGYLATTTHIHRTVGLTTITSAGNWQADSMGENPPGAGSGATFPTTSAMASVTYSPTIDRLVIATTGLTRFRHYVTQYQTSGNPFDIIFAGDNGQINESTAALGMPDAFANAATGLTFFSVGGMLYCSISPVGGGAATSCFLFAIPICDWTYTSTINQVLITPSFTLTNCDRLTRVVTASVQEVAGGSPGTPLQSAARRQFQDQTRDLAIKPEPYRISYRTVGITDNSGTWTLLDQLGSLSSVPPANAIQFRYEFRTFGFFMVPPRILGTVCIYNELVTDRHWLLSTAQSSITTPTFAWRQAVAYNTTYPTFRVRLFDTVAGTALLDDDTLASAYGTWQKSTDGVTWGSYNTADMTTNTTFIRYTPTSPPSGISVNAFLTSGSVLSAAVLQIGNDSATNGSTTFTDQSASAHTVTIASGSPAYSNTTAPTGLTTSIHLSSARLSSANSLDWMFGNSNFTIEGYFYMPATSSQTIITTKSAAATVDEFLIWTPDGSHIQFGFASVNTGSTWDLLASSSNTYTANTWTHFAFYRIGNNFYGAVSGTVTSLGSTSVSGVETANPISIGEVGDASSPMNGYLASLRLTKGYARYGTGTFTPPTLPFPSV